MAKTSKKEQRHLVLVPPPPPIAWAERCSICGEYVGREGFEQCSICERDVCSVCIIETSVHGDVCVECVE